MKELIFKIVILSEKGAGTSTMIKRFLNNRLITDYSDSINCNWFTQYTIIDNNKIKNQIWRIYNLDSAITPHLTSYAHGVIYVFDLSRIETVNFVLKAYEKTNFECDRVIIGNKSDLYNDSLDECINKSINKINGIKLYKTSMMNNGHIKKKA